MRMNPLAMLTRHRTSRYESPSRGEDYLEVMTNLQLAAWMAALGDEEPDSAVRRCCIKLEKRMMDWKVKGIICAIRNSQTPTNTLLMLVNDMERTLSGEELSESDVAEMKARF